jgi:23S rRNA (uracil1939-C5)-methyltransferase
MGRRRRKSYPHLENVKIVDMSADGKAIGKVDDIVVMVKNVVPGDVVNVQVNGKKKKMLHGYVTEFISHSEDKIEAFCSHFGVCGGCKWQHLSYEKQLEYKQKRVYDCFERIAKLDIEDKQPIFGTNKTEYYRNKLEYSFTDRRWLNEDEIDTDKEITDLYGAGFHVPERFDKVVDVKQCYLQKEPSNELRLKIKQFAIEKGYSFSNLRTHEGFMRNMFIRTSSTNEIMLLMIFGENDQEKIKECMEFIKAEFTQITSLMFAVNTSLNDSIYNLDIKNYAGESFIYEEMEGLKFKISPKSFYQTNSEQAYELYKITREFAEIEENDTVYDLYTGTGTIANFVAKKAKKVIGVESVEDAIIDARENSKVNNIDNTKFVVGDMKDILTEDFVKENGKPDVIIIDPPRAGLHTKVIDVLLKAGAPKLVYVSCNPATQARDMELLSEKYKILISKPVDMFPHTHHIENVLKLRLK